MLLTQDPSASCADELLLKAAAWNGNNGVNTIDCTGDDENKNENDDEDIILLLTYTRASHKSQWTNLMKTMQQVALRMSRTMKYIWNWQSCHRILHKYRHGSREKLYPNRNQINSRIEE